MPLPTAPRPPSPLPHRPTPPFPGIPWRRQPPAEENEGWWSITFSDLVLLLFAFFVLWHIADKQRAVAVARTTHLAAAEPQETGAPAAAPDLPAPEPLAETAPAPEPAVPPPSAPFLTPAERPAPLQEEASVWREMQAEVTRYVHEQGLDRAVGVISTEQGLVISLNDTITFIRSVQRKIRWQPRRGKKRRRRHRKRTPSPYSASPEGRGLSGFARYALFLCRAKPCFPLSLLLPS